MCTVHSIHIQTITAYIFEWDRETEGKANALGFLLSQSNLEIKKLNLQNSGPQSNDTLSYQYTNSLHHQLGLSKMHGTRTKLICSSKHSGYPWHTLTINPFHLSQDLCKSLPPVIWPAAAPPTCHVTYCKPLPHVMWPTVSPTQKPPVLWPTACPCILPLDLPQVPPTCQKTYYKSLPPVKDHCKSFPSVTWPTASPSHLSLNLLQVPLTSPKSYYSSSHLSQKLCKSPSPATQHTASPSHLSQVLLQFFPLVPRPVSSPAHQPLNLLWVSPTCPKSN